ncbi:MAG TPA: lipoyl(octanoyl) transferase LipB [Dehalococcoidia bacterium]|nr:lipoyl(octanoyl) transferase LipB [Dehalococcoidia bacterium]
MPDHPRGENRAVRLARLGLTDYEPAYELQRTLNSELRGERGGPGWLLVTEHRPVITLGRNHPTADLKGTPEEVAAAGIPIIQSDRGGDITYHGPGQLVAYPIVDLRDWGVGPVDLVCGLEATAIRVASSFGISAERREEARGVWVGERKLASVGVRVSGGVSMHGIAINVSPNFAHFELINACGMPNAEVTGLTREAGVMDMGQGLDLQRVTQEFIEAFAVEFHCEVLAFPVS